MKNRLTAMIAAIIMFHRQVAIKIGYFAARHPHSAYWALLSWMLDSTLRPVTGPGYCYSCFRSATYYGFRLEPGAHKKLLMMVIFFTALPVVAIGIRLAKLLFSVPELAVLALFVTAVVVFS